MNANEFKKTITECIGDFDGLGYDGVLSLLAIGLDSIGNDLNKELTKLKKYPTLDGSMTMGDKYCAMSTNIYITLRNRGYYDIYRERSEN